jgi:exosortase A
MKLDSDTALHPSDATGLQPAHAGWSGALFLVGAAAVLVALFYFGTAASIVEIWYRSETFAHGFIVVPVVLWLIWRQRATLATLTPSPDYRGLPILAVLGFGWLLAELAGVLVVQQLAMVAMLPVLVFTVLGREVTWALAFPLAFLLFGVPVGEALIPPLMSFTADFTVAMLQLSGIPVYREGTFFTIPSGNWSVVEGCSGLRYLIASLTAGCLYAYLTYRSLARRALFVLASIGVPIVANGLRAYMIVMIAHLSAMRLALGIDHYIYGWVFFGVVMLLLFWIGSFWQEPERAPPVADAARLAKPFHLRPLLPAAVAALVVAALWPAYAAYLDRQQGAIDPIALAAPQEAGAWHRDSAEMTDWRPRYKGTDASIFQVYRKGDRTVALYLGYYRHQRQDAELVNSQNVMVVQKHAVWSNVGEAQKAEAVGGSSVDIRETRLRSASQRLLIWDWFYLDGRRTTDPYLAKRLLAKDRLLLAPDDGMAIIVATPYADQPTPAEAVLREFLGDMLPQIEAVSREAEQ